MLARWVVAVASAGSSPQDGNGCVSSTLALRRKRDSNALHPGRRYPRCCHCEGLACRRWPTRVHKLPNGIVCCHRGTLRPFMLQRLDCGYTCGYAKINLPTTCRECESGCHENRQWRDVVPEQLACHPLPRRQSQTSSVHAPVCASQTVNTWEHGTARVCSNTTPEVVVLELVLRGGCWPWLQNYLRSHGQPQRPWPAGLPMMRRGWKGGIQ